MASVVVKGYSIVVLTGADARTERPYNGLHVLLYYNGRSDRASLQRVTREDLHISWRFGYFAV